LKIGRFELVTRAGENSCMGLERPDRRVGYTAINDGEIGEGEQYNAAGAEMRKMEIPRRFLFLCTYLCLGPYMGPRASHLSLLP
jgi:hypothetical protein